MAEVVWAEPAQADLDGIADYIAVENREAAQRLVQRVFERVASLGTFPDMGSTVPELGESQYRQLVEPPCRIIYRVAGARVLVLHVRRAEQSLEPDKVRRSLDAIREAAHKAGTDRLSKMTIQKVIDSTRRRRRKS